MSRKPSEDLKKCYFIFSIIALCISELFPFAKLDINKDIL